MCTGLAVWRTIHTVQEVFSRCDGRKTPLCEQEFYELLFGDSGDSRQPCFIVKQSHAQWSEVDRQIMWDELESERFPTREEAKKRYEARRSALAEKGFVYSVTTN